MLYFLRLLGMNCIIGLAASGGATEDVVLAVVDGRVVLSSEFEATLGDKLLRLRNEEFAIRRVALNDYIDGILLLHEATKREITVPELLEKEVAEKVARVTESEVRAVVESSPAIYQRLSGDQATSTAEADIARRRLAARQIQFLSLLRRQYPVEIRLEQPRLAHAVGGGRSKGDQSAVVTIVEFADFQCPFCSNVSASLKRIADDFGHEVLIKSKQFPLPSHPQAEHASEAALCAGEQGQYWEMHDKLFEEQGLVAQGQFGEIARRAGLDSEALDACLKARTFKSEVERDRADGTNLGVNSTPTLFVNGLMLVGGKPYELLKMMVRAEMKRAQGTDDKPGQARSR